MKVKSTKTIKVLSRTLEITKTPKERNINTRNVSISEAEKNEVNVNDTVHLRVCDVGGNLVAEATYTGKQFHSQLVARQKQTKYGSVINFYTLGY